MSCACGMDSVGTCLVCGARLCSDHALRGYYEHSSFDRIQAIQARGSLDVRLQAFGVSPPEDPSGTFLISLHRVRSDLRPLLRFQAQRQAFLSALRRPEVVCGDCRVNGAFRAASATPQPAAPALGAGGSQRLRDAVAAYLLGDAVARVSMASDKALMDALLQDLSHLAREKAERVQTPVEWEAVWHTAPYNSYYRSRYVPGKVRATEEVFHVVDVTRFKSNSYTGDGYEDVVPQYMNRHGQWGSFENQWGGSIERPQGLFPDSELETVTVKKAGWFSDAKKVLRMSWSDKPPQPGLGNILKRAAELLAPAV